MKSVIFMITFFASINTYAAELTANQKMKACIEIERTLNYDSGNSLTVCSQGKWSATKKPSGSIFFTWEGNMSRQQDIPDQCRGNFVIRSMCGLKSYAVSKVSCN